MPRAPALLDPDQRYREYKRMNSNGWRRLMEKFGTEKVRQAREWMETYEREQGHGRF